MSAVTWMVAIIGTSTVAGVIWWSRREVGRVRDRLEESLVNLNRLEHTFARFVPHPLVDQMIAHHDPSAGEDKEVTVLFADLAGFTSLSEHVPAAEMVRLLNGYFDRMSRVISDSGGQVTTFVGDGMLAFFGAFEPNPWQSNDAVRAALGMRAQLAAYNVELHSQGLPSLSFGIGLHRGHGVAGLVGSREHLDFTVVGGVVNIAARLQAHTRTSDVDILLSREVREHLDPRFVVRELPPANLRGVGRPVELYTVDQLQSDQSGAPSNRATGLAVTPPGKE